MTPTEHELDASMTRTGRVRRQQFERTMRCHAVPPSKRIAVPFAAPPPSSGETKP